MELQSFDMEKGESKRIPSISQCIYCARSDVPLRKEHVIPYALGGNTTIFDGACCRICQEIIQPYEQKVLRSDFGEFRARIEAPTREPKSRKQRTQLRFIEVDDQARYLRELAVHDVPIGEAPLSFSVWNLAPPRILGEGWPDSAHIGTPWTYCQRDVAGRWLDRVREETGCGGHIAVRVGTVDREAFLRFLAKTAHAFAVSECGGSAFRPLLEDLILCRADDLDRFVGGDPQLAPPASHPASMTELVLGRVKGGALTGYTVVRLRLYPLLGTPAHVVIVGAPLSS